MKAILLETRPAHGLTGTKLLKAGTVVSVTGEKNGRLTANYRGWVLNITTEQATPVYMTRLESIN